MKTVQISDLKPDMITAEDIITANDQLLFPAGTILTKQNISRIRFYNIELIKIENFTTKDSSDSKKSEPVENTPATKSVSEHVPSGPKAGSAQNPTLSQKIQFSPAFHQYQMDYATAVTSVTGILENFVSTDSHIDEQLLLAETGRLFDSTSSSLHLFDMLHNMRQLTDSIFAHSLNVALIARTLGKWLKFSPDDIECLALCGLFHDIGKIMLPKELLNKKERLTDEEFAQIRRHPLLGFDRLKAEEINPHIKKAALMHHERSDGSGYPHNLVGREIHPFAQIIAIADVYDAMTSSRVYRSPLCPFEVISSFEREGLHKYNTQYILTFLEHIANTYQSNRIILNDGRSGTIIMLNKSSLSKPIIQLDNQDFIDLTDTPGLFIKSVL